MSQTYWRLFPKGEATATHLEGVTGDSYTLCGMDTAGDLDLYSRPPQELNDGRPHRITCSHCLQIIEHVRDYLKEKGRISDDDTGPQ